MSPSYPKKVLASGRRSVTGIPPGETLGGTV